MTKSTRVGAFVFFGLALLVIAVFTIGENRRLWDPKTTYGAVFKEVAGLKPGAPVRMGGVDVGTVTKVGYSDNAGDVRVYVSLSIVRSETVRIREDTVASIINKGLLGDKMIELSISDGKANKLADGGTLKTAEPLDLQKYIVKVEEIANKAEAAINNIEQATRPFKDQRFGDDMKGAVSSLNTILHGVAHEDGLAHRLIFDPSEARRVDATLANLELASRELADTMGNLRDVTGRVRTGPGTAHAFLYDEAVAQDAAASVGEVRKSLEAVRTGNGLAHVAIYGDDSTRRVSSDLAAITGDLRQIVAGVRAGKGTIGGLLVDPSIYEDIKATVGNLERNQVLRALVRYSIRQDEKAPKEAPTPAPPK